MIEKEHAIDMVANGSKLVSSYLHLSTDLDKARYWSRLGETFRGEDKDTQLMCRLDIWNMYEEGRLEADDVVDLSTAESRREYFVNVTDFSNEAKESPVIFVAEVA